MLRGYVAQAATGQGYGWTYPVPERIQDLADRVAMHVAAANRRGAAADESIVLPTITERDVVLLTRLGRHLVDTATATLPARPDANPRLSLGQSLLDVRDAVQSLLVVQGERPERRASER